MTCKRNAINPVNPQRSSFLRVSFGGAILSEGSRSVEHRRYLSPVWSSVLFQVAWKKQADLPLRSWHHAQSIWGSNVDFPNPFLLCFGKCVPVIP